MIGADKMDNPYVFISYAHANSDVVLPTVQAMKNSNINVWYDEGIVAGSEWPEFIAEKVVSCSKFVLFVSNAYLKSQNCKRELNFAISRKKEILTIFMEPVNLSPGMEMQLGTYQAIYRTRYPSAQAFFDSLCKEPFFNECRIGESGFYSSPSARESYNAPSGNTYGAASPTMQPVRRISQHTAPQPVQKPVQPPVQQYSQPAPQSVQQLVRTAANTTESSKPVKRRLIAFLLAFVLGHFGAHYFYLGKKVYGIICLVLCFTGIPTIAALVESALFLFSSNESLEKRFNCEFC